jgi:hypothetical protein
VVKAPSLVPEQGLVYYSFIQASIKEERDRRSAQESRATGVVTSSGALVTLVFALVAVVLGKDYKFASGATWLVIAALGLFALASLFALLAGLLLKYEVPDKRTLEATLGSHWTDTEASARLACAWMSLDTLLTLRSGNNRKSWWLDWALRMQLSAVVTLGAAVAWELYRRI